MTEHEKLKAVCDLIEHIPMYWYKNIKGFYQIMNRKWDFRKIDVREIIFTQEFMDKLVNYLEDNRIVAPSHYKTFLISLHKELNDPVDYLYNLLELWQK